MPRGEATARRESSWLQQQPGEQGGRFLIRGPGRAHRLPERGERRGDLRRRLYQSLRRAAGEILLPHTDDVQVAPTAGPRQRLAEVIAVRGVNQRVRRQDRAEAVSRADGGIEDARGAWGRFLLAHLPDERPDRVIGHLARAAAEPGQ